MVSLVNPPAGFLKALGELPEEVVVHEKAWEGSDVTLWFLRDFGQLKWEVSQIFPFSDNGGLSVAWPRRASQAPADLSQRLV